MINSLYIKNGTPGETGIDPDRFALALGDPQALLWVDMEGEAPQVCEPILREIFKFHPLAINDALYQTHVSKLDNWDSYLFIALNAIFYHQEEGSLDTIELDVFLGDNYIITHHDLPIPALKRAWNSVGHDLRHSGQGADHWLYKLTDELTVDYMQTVDELDEGIEWVEDQVFSQPTPEIIQKLFDLKRATLLMRRSLSPMREVLNKLARDDYSVIDSRDQVYFRDVYDHLVRLYDIVEGLRDMVGGALDTYLSVINNRMNEIMKTLTVITTLFMPLSFITGFFGMNFFMADPPISVFTETTAFIIMLGLIIFVPLGMYSWIRRRGWM